MSLLPPYRRSQWAGKSGALEEVSLSIAPGQPPFWQDKGQGTRRQKKTAIKK